MKPFWPKFWITAGYLGFCPWAPGTCGTLGGVLLAMLAWRYSGTPWIQASLLAAGILLFSGMTLLHGDWAEKTFGRKDPPQAVSDEVAGFLLAVLWAPAAPEWMVLGAGFVLFRLFDIWKPWPLRRWQALPGGLGILADDLGAGLMANAVLQAALRRFVPYSSL